MTVVPLRPVRGQGIDPSKKGRRRWPSPSFSEAEQARLRAALKNLRFSYGSWACLAEIIGVHPDTLKAMSSGRKPVSSRIALAAAKASGQPLDRLIGSPTSANRCPTCGRCG